MEEKQATVKVSDLIARFLKDKGIRHVFGIVGSANSHIFDSIYRLGYTQMVCVHHEQAATMAMQTYYRTSGKMTAAIVTAGGGSSNAITGVISAWADSIPGMVISGQENTKYIRSMEGMRMWGIQGFDSTHMVSKVTKYAARVMDPLTVQHELDKSYHIASSGRPGPVWLDFPMDVQGSTVKLADLKSYEGEERPTPAVSVGELNQIVELIRSSRRPVLWLGNGIRLSGAVDLLPRLLSALPFPALVSWAGVDTLDSSHPLNYGRAGVYGQRAANFVLQNADLVLAIGTRLSMSMIGYEHSELARAAKIVAVDIDESEIRKLQDRLAIGVVSDAGIFVQSLLSRVKEIDIPDVGEWRERCNGYRATYPWIGPEHEDKNHFMNSYRFMDRLSQFLKPDQVVVTDMGTALLSGHQALKLSAGQRMMTSTGLGEMGYGLPGAMGASFARDKGEVLCLNCDGGMMMNLQELQTVAHHQLPIKLFVFNNDGYLMIKHTQKNLFKGRYSGTDRASGVSCPDFSKVAAAFGFTYYSIRSWEEFEPAVRAVQAEPGPTLCDVFMDPEQYFLPKQSVAVRPDGTLVSPPLEDLSPLLSREELRANMIVGLHQKSEGLG